MFAVIISNRYKGTNGQIPGMRGDEVSDKMVLYRIPSCTCMTPLKYIENKSENNSGELEI